MSAGAVILISVGLFFFAQMLTPLFVIFSGCSIPFRTGWNLQPDDGTVLLFLCPCRSIFRCLLRHGRYDTAYDHHAAGHLPAASAWYPAGTSGLWNDGMYCYDLYCSWIAAGVSFLLLWHRDAAHIRDNRMTERWGNYGSETAAVFCGQCRERKF